MCIYILLISNLNGVETKFHHTNADVPINVSANTNDKHVFQREVFDLYDNEMRI